MFSTKTSVIVFLLYFNNCNSSSIASSLDNPILQPTHGKLFFEKLEAKLSYLPPELILHINSDHSIKVSNIKPV
jgi:hypothetical protein